MAWLTWKAAFRFRLVAVVLLLMLVTVIALPVVIKDDGTARGFVQILITYTLTVISGLLGLCTLWLACGTLARDVEECQIQLLATKPIARWQIWLGKWLGIVTLDAAILCVTGTALFALLQWRATRLEPKQQHILRNEVLVARGAAKPEYPLAELEAEADRLLRERIRALQHTNISSADLPLIKAEILEQLKADYQQVPPMILDSPGYIKWEIQLGNNLNRLRGKPLYIRAKFYAAERTHSGTITGVWQAGVPGTAKAWRSEPMSLAPETFHEIEMPPDLFDGQGRMTVVFFNLSNVALLFPMDDGLEVLYPAGGFVGNYARGLGIILCWMALLAAVGLMSASYLSFPVAAFVSVALLVFAFSTGLMATAVNEGVFVSYNPQTNEYVRTPLDFVFVPVFKLILSVVSVVKQHSPIDSLSTGRVITWAELALAVLRIVVMLGGLAAALGIGLFYKRELAAGEATR